MPVLYANKRIRVVSNTIIHVRRQLQGNGKILVQKNFEVAPHHVLGTSTVSSGFSKINLAKKLGVSAKEAPKYMTKQTGQKIFKGELLALKKGLFGKKVVTSPTDCIIDTYNDKTGELQLKFLPKQLPMTSGVYGIVDEVEPLSGEVIIKTMATQVFGIYGSGKERSGFLHILETPGLIHPSQINADLSQKILLVNGLIFGEALRKCVGYGVKGIVTGGINLSDYISMVGSLENRQKLGSDIGISVIATEGFGSIGIGMDILNAINTHQDKFVFINGNTNNLILPSLNPDSILAVRKVVLPIVRTTYLQAEITTAELRTGLRVRVISSPYLGQQGVITAIDNQPTLLDTGISTILLTVALRNKKIKIPYPNVEIIE